MNLQRLIGEHTIDVDLLPDAPVVLDVGCRYFNFCEEIFALRPNARIIALDPATDVEPPTDSRIQFMNRALVGDGYPFTMWMMPGGWFAVKTPCEGMVEVGTIRMMDLLAQCVHFDLVKLDCEGAEFGIIDTWPGVCAKQINIEFHDPMVCGKGLPEDYFEKLFSEKMPDYRVIQNPPDKLGVHADCLLVLK